MEILLAPISLFILLCLSALITSKGANPNRLVTKLINYNSISSPYYNPSETIHQRNQRTIQSSISRFSYLSSRISSILASDEIPKTYLVPSSILPQFFVNFSIGQPPVPQLAVMDTGSSLFWVKCLPCTNCSGGHRIFDPSKSSTYSILSCENSYECGSYSCSPMNKCTYYMQYVEGPYSVGYLSSEQITLEDGQLEVVVDGIQFGCGHNNGKFKDGNFNGVLGLGITQRDKSLVSQLGNKFSYCTSDVKDLQYNYNRLAFGEGLTMDGSSSPLRAISGHYYIALEGISIGVMRLDIDPIVFKKLPRVNNGVIIDSGTGLTFLAKSAFQTLREKIEELFSEYWDLTRHDMPPLPLCYEGDIDHDLQDFPIIGFHLANGSDLVLDAKSSFIQVQPNVFCLAFVPSDINKRNHENLTIVGMMAQQNYNIGYDLDSMKIYFQNVDCEFLDDY